MISWLKKQLEGLSAPWRYIVYVALIFAIGFAFFALMNQVQSCGYSKARKEYQEKDAALKTEYDKLAGENKQLRTQIADLEPQLLAYKSAQEAGKKVDDGLAQKIEDVGRESANAEANAQGSFDCSVRAQRVCDLFRASDKRFDCKPIFDECAR